MFQQHHGESLSEAWTHFKDLLQKVPHHGIDLWLQVKIFYDHVTPVTRRTIDQSAGGKFRNRNAEESWALLEDLILYDNENVPSTSDRRLIKLENQVQRLMEAHLAPTQLTQVKKITSSCEICSGPHDTQYCMENPEQAFVEYASSCTDEAGEGLVSNFIASQDARLSKFEADFKRQQIEMTNKIDIVLKAITNRMAGALLNDMVKNPKLNVNSTTSVLSNRSYPTIDPQCSSHPSTSINAVKTCSKEASYSQTSLLQTRIGIGTEQTKEPKSTLEDEFQDLHLNLPVLEVLAHAPIYNAMLDKYVESLELGKNGSAFIQGERTGYAVSSGSRYAVFNCRPEQYQENRGLDLRRRGEKSIIYNTSFLGEYECSSLALDRRRKKEEDEIGSLETSLNFVSDQEIYKKKEGFSERKLSEKFVLRGDANPIRTLGDYSKPSHKGYRNTIELPVGNNVVPLRSDTIRLVQNGCSFHGLQSEDPNQHLKDFLKLMESLDLDSKEKKYIELTEQEQLQDDCDVQATKIILQGLPSDVYALVNHCQSAKDIWE
ncbi:hypothetical protein Tco_0237445 [Tanacetum coccineum]